MSKLWDMSKPFGLLSLPLPSELAGMMALNDVHTAHTCIVLSISTALILSVLCHARVPPVLWTWTSVRSTLEPLKVARMEPRVLTLLDLTGNMLPVPCHHFLSWIAFGMILNFYSFLLFLSFNIVVIVCRSGMDPTAPLAMMIAQEEVRTCVFMDCALILTE